LTCLPIGKYLPKIEALALVDAETITRLRTVICQLSRRLNSATPSIGLSPSQISVLGSVAANPEIGVGELAEIEGLNPTMVSRIVGKLTDAGLIRRLADPDDRRAARLEVTGTGRRALVRIRRERTAHLLGAVERMSGADAAGLFDALAALESLAQQFGIEP
jgi:DNA-binding MarR family transcriptional regulator